MPKHVELLWFEGCPNHGSAQAMVEEVAAQLGVAINIERVEVPDEATGNRVRFPGSPTIRVDGRDIEPGFGGCDECTPRCRVYATSSGLRGVPERAWIVAALR
jgi:hypothetical protein